LLYIKTKLNEHVEIKVELYEDEIYTRCGGCNKEVPIEPENIATIINEGSNFAGTTFYCEKCSKGVITHDSSQS
jgi:uncharacterized protein with PIN domain